MNRKICLELEIFDVGCLYNAKKLEDEGLFGSAGLSSPGCYLHYVMGHGGQPATMKQLMYIHEEGEKLFPDAKVCVSAAGGTAVRYAPGLRPPKIPTGYRTCGPIRALASVWNCGRRRRGIRSGRRS